VAQKKLHISIVLSIVFFLCLNINLFAQVPDANDPRKENTIEQKIETIAEQAEDENIDYTTLLDELAYYLEHPINLNFASREDLEQFGLLDDIQINNLLKHIRDNGKLMAIYELQTIDGFDAVTIQRILPFVIVKTDFTKPKVSFKELKENGQHQLFIRWQRILEEQKGYLPIEDSLLAKSPNSRYLGSPDRLYTRYRFNYGTNISWGFTAEKDAGEEFFKGSQKNGFDFYSAHFYVRNMGKLKALALGDYHAQFGQGLTLWTGLAFGKSIFITNIKRSAIGIRPYTAVDENRFLRGAAVTYQVIKNLEATIFYSDKKIDANTGTNPTDSLDNREDGLIVTSFQVSGFHRTPRELENKNILRERVYGGNLSYKIRGFKIGITAAKTEFEGTLTRKLTYYNQFEFNSNQLFNLGMDYNYVYKNVNFFGEISRSDNGAIAYVNGAIMSLDPRLVFTVLHRNYPRNYHSINAIPIGENTRPANEQGILMGIQAIPAAKWNFTAYYDKFIFPWMKYQVDAPSHGYEVMAQLSYVPTRKIELYGRYRQRNRFKNTTEDIEDIDFIVAEIQDNYRFNATYNITPSIRLRNRVEFTTYKRGDNATENGYMIYQDIIYKALSSPLSFSFRYAIFQTESYNSRMYAYENDVLYAFSIPAFYDNGTRAYLTLRYTLVKNIDLWLRYAQTFYYNRNTIGSGLEEIQGNTRSEIKAQVRFRF
jgi:hypothetical protein